MPDQRSVINEARAPTNLASQADVLRGSSRVPARSYHKSSLDRIKNSAETITVEARYNEGPRDCDWQNLFAITRFCYIEVLFHTFYYHCRGKENCSLYRRLRYIKVR